MKKNIFLIILSTSLISLESSAMRTRAARVLAKAWIGAGILTDDDIKRQTQASQQANYFQDTTYQQKQNADTYKSNQFSQQQQNQSLLSKIFIPLIVTTRWCLSKICPSKQEVDQIVTTCDHYARQCSIAINNSRNIDNQWNSDMHPVNGYINTTHYQYEKCELPPASEQEYRMLRDKLQTLAKDAPRAWRKSKLEKRTKAIEEIVNSWEAQEKLEHLHSQDLYQNQPDISPLYDTIAPTEKTQKELSVRQKELLELLSTVQKTFEPALKGDIRGFLSGIHGEQEIVDFSEISPNMTHPLSQFIEGIMYDENGYIKEQLTEHEQREINLMYKEYLMSKFSSLREHLANELHELAHKGYVKFEDCMNIQKIIERINKILELKSSPEHSRICDKIKALGNEYKNLVEKGRNNPVNQHFFKMLNMPAKENALAYGEKHNVFQTYPWLRYKIDPEAAKQKEIVTQQLQQECTPALDVTQKYHQQLQNNPHAPQEIIDIVQLRALALKQAQDTGQFKPLQDIFEQECNAGLDLTQDHIQLIPVHELGIIYSNQEIFIKLAKELLKGDQFAQASETLNYFWSIYITAHEVGPEIYTKKADKEFTQELNEHMKQPLIITTDPVHKEILTGLKEVFITRPIWVVKGFAHRTQEIVKTGVDVSIDALCGGDRWYVGIKQIAKQSAHFIDHYLLSDLTRKLNLYQVRKFNEGIKQGNMSPEFAKHMQQEMGYQDSFEYEKELSELVETLQADGNIVHLIGRFLDQTTTENAWKMCEYLSSQEGCEKVGALIADQLAAVGAGKVAGLAIEGAAGAAGTVLSEFSQPGISVVATEGAPLIIVANGVADGTIAETIRKVAEATKKAAEVGVPGANAASELAQFMEGQKPLPKKQQKITNINRDALLNELTQFKSVKLKVGRHNILLDKRGLKHILKRHHPEFWNGTIKGNQSFFSKKMNTKEIVKIIKAVIKQNRDIINEQGLLENFQITGIVNNKTYRVGFEAGGRIGQFYEKLK